VCLTVLVEQKQQASQSGNRRHRSFRYNDVSITASLFLLVSDKDKADALVNILFDAIFPIARSSGCRKGLSFLSHIRHHLEDGLGLVKLLTGLCLQILS
jgi:hypothetical protein